MIDITFRKDRPTNPSLEAVLLYEDQVENSLPLGQYLNSKPDAKVVEVIKATSTGTHRMLIASLGNRLASSKLQRERCGAELYKTALQGVDVCLTVDVRNLDVDALDVIMGILLASWSFNCYKSRKEPFQQLAQVEVICSDPSKLEATFQRFKAIATGVFYAKDLTSEPPNALFPAAYAERVKDLERLGVVVEILDEQAMQKLGMTALLTVGKGSCHPPRMVILRWIGAEDNRDPVVLVGKGVCFDSGGLCLKPGKSQVDMKWDKAGAGVVAGVIKALAMQKAKTNVIGILGLAENMPDGGAARPGDVISSLSGKTIEIVNTDAEGRLVLADCLSYAQQEFNPMVMVDLGTLTTETFASLGTAYAGLYSNDPQLAQTLRKAADLSGDQLWELPMGPYFAKQLESTIADIKNMGLEGCGENGAAAEFLRAFVSDAIPWAHIDIAGVSWTLDETPKYVTGYGVRLLEEWIMESIDS